MVIRSDWVVYNCPIRPDGDPEHITLITKEKFMKKLARATIAAVTILGLGVPSIVGASSSIGTTGPSSTNTIHTSSDNDYKAMNNNTVSANIGANQHASSGAVTGDGNTTVGSAASGAANNSNAVAASVAIDNSSAPMPMPAAASSEADMHSSTISGPTGPDSKNSITTTTTNDVTMTNNNKVDVSNNVTQSASTGNVNVNHNTTGGDATSGPASNSSSTTLNLSVSN
jgi:hypothetical protein